MASLSYLMNKYQKKNDTTHSFPVLFPEDRQGCSKTIAKTVYQN